MPRYCSMKLIVYFDLLVTADYFCGAGHSYVIPLVDRKWATCQEGQEDGSFIFLHTQCLNMCLSPHKLFETFKTKQQQQQICSWRFYTSSAENTYQEALTKCVAR